MELQSKFNNDMSGSKMMLTKVFLLKYFSNTGKINTIAAMRDM